MSFRLQSCRVNTFPRHGPAAHHRHALPVVSSPAVPSPPAAQDAVHVPAEDPPTPHRHASAAVWASSTAETAMMKCLRGERQCIFTSPLSWKVNFLSCLPHLLRVQTGRVQYPAGAFFAFCLPLLKSVLDLHFSKCHLGYKVAESIQFLILPYMIPFLCQFDVRHILLQNYLSWWKPSNELLCLSWCKIISALPCSDPWYLSNLGVCEQIEFSKTKG
jgi:hypothetical protein